MKKILVPLPAYGFDPTESAVPWTRLTNEGHNVVFATPEGEVAAADRRMLTGEDLPFLFRASLRAEQPAVTKYEVMQASPAFQKPLKYTELDVKGFDALLLPGGHDKGMRPYLESPILKACIVEFFETNKPVAAICHGTLLAARAEKAGKSVLWGRKTTGLTRNQELVAWWMTRLTLKDYYRTYDTLMADELLSYLRSREDYDSGPGVPIPMSRDSETNLRPGFVVKDGNYLSARWPGDAHRFAEEFVTMLK